MKKQQQQPSYLDKLWFAPLLFGVMILLLFGKSIQHEINIDDEIILNMMPKKTDFSNLWSVFNERYNGSDYRPLVILSFVIEKLLFGELDLKISHTVNLVLYYLICLSLYYFLKKIVKDEQSYLPLIATLLFLCHPIHVSVVASLKNRDNMLSLLIGLSAFHIPLYLKDSNFIKRSVGVAISFLILFVSTFAKMDALGLLIIFPIFYYFFIRKNLLEIFVIVLLFFSLTTYYRDIVIFKLAGPIKAPSFVTFEENPLVSNPSLLNKISLLFQTLLYYTKLMIIPSGYYFYFGYAKIKLLPIFHPVIILSVLLHISIGISGLYLFLKKNIVGFFIICYFVCLLYALNFVVPVAGVIADRYAFISSTFYCVLLGAFLIWLSKLSFIKQYLPKNRLAILTIFLTTIYSLFSFNRNLDWKNRDTLYAADYPHLKTSVNALRMMAEHEISKSKDATNNVQRQDFLNKAVRFCDEGISVCDSVAMLYQIKANALISLKEIDAAFTTLNIGISKSYQKTGVYASKAMLFENLDVKDSAIHYYKKAIAIDTSQSELYLKLTDLKNKKGLMAESLTENQALVKERPHFLAGYQNLGNTYLYLGDTMQAVDYFIIAFQKGVYNPEMANGIKTYLIQKGLTNRLSQIEPYTE